MGMDILINTQIDQRKKNLRVYMPKLPTKQNQCYNKLCNIIIESQIQFNLTLNLTYIPIGLGRFSTQAWTKAWLNLPPNLKKYILLLYIGTNFSNFVL